MWYSHNRPQPAQPPSPQQQWVLRFLILLGLGAAALFFWGLLRPKNVGHPLLFGLLAFGFVYAVLRVLWEWYHYWRISVPHTPVLKRDFSVDIFTTFVPGEPYEMLVNTLEAIQKIEYPHTTYLCDEGNDPYLIDVCKRLGINHVTREQKINAKAGNINNALRQATGEICLILDPDHLPVPDFFNLVLPHFQDEKVGFVQTVQGYYNIYDNIISKGSAQQTFQFYGPMMMGMNSYGTAQAIGANCTFRRAALDSIGGHAAGLAEDMNTSMHLHAQGWRSVYVPAMLTRGLVPNTLSSYYQQQLKWSRGVFELLVTSYPKFFRRFSWRQKLHYGLLPWHYFMGFIFLINFLIPILSLFLGLSPMKINFAYFLLLATPLIGATFIIRQYVQRWVMEEDERGVQIQGGLMAIGTWWIYILGFVFTLLRRKVPYNPTPKDGRDENILALNAPNLALAGLTLVSIGYGLHYDYNPYSLAMSGFAVFNIGLIAFMVFISWQNQWRRYKEKHPALKWIFIQIWRFKDAFWRFRRKAYWGVRLAALPLFLGMLALLAYFASSQKLENLESLPAEPSQSSLLLGQYRGDSPHATPTEVTALQAWRLNLNWQQASSADSAKALHLPPASTEQYQMLVAVPTAHNYDSSLHFLQQLSRGHYDAVLYELSQQLLKRSHQDPPLFILPLAAPLLKGLNPEQQQYLAQAFRQAWMYLHGYLSGMDVPGLIYVLPHFAPTKVSRFFPGSAYVDWLSYAPADASIPEDSLVEQWAALRRTSPFELGLPVWLQVPASKRSDSQELLWKRFAENHPSVQGLLFPAGLPISKKWSRANTMASPSGKIPRSAAQPDQRYAHFYQNLQGVNYLKSADWRASEHPLIRRESDRDLQAMRELGLNAIKRYGPGVYDQNVLRSASAAEIAVIYAFWTEELHDFSAPSKKRSQLESRILNTVKRYRHQPGIVAWHLGGAPYNKLGNIYAKPELLYQRRAYLDWLGKLCAQITALDSTRPISAELDYSPYLLQNLAYLSHHAPHLAAVGVNYSDKELLDTTEWVHWSVSLRPLFINRFPPGSGLAPKKLSQGWLLAAWQDEVFANHVSFDGLLSSEGNKKTEYRLLEVDSQDLSLPEIRVLPPAQRSFGGENRWFSAYFRYEDQWLPAESLQEEWSFHWSLIKTDIYGNPIGRKPLKSHSSHLILNVPQSLHLYRLHLRIAREGYSVGTFAPLRNAVYQGPYLEVMSRSQSDFYFQ